MFEPKKSQRVIILLTGLLFVELSCSPHSYGQQAKAAPAPAVAAAGSVSKPAADPAGKIPLTADEAKDLEFNQLQIENLDFKVDQLRNQIMMAKQKLAKDTSDLAAKFSKAHDVDLTKYRLDPQAKAFIPLLLPAAKKPAASKQ
jgi:hypothetical protein